MTCYTFGLPTWLIYSGKCETFRFILERIVTSFQVSSSSYIKPNKRRWWESCITTFTFLCLLQEIMIGEALALAERKRNNSGMKEMLHDATKLTHKLRFLVEEVRHSPCVCLCMIICLSFGIPSCMCNMRGTPRGREFLQTIHVDSRMN